MQKHLNLPVPVKVSTDSIMKSCFRTSLILLEGLFILVRRLVHYFCRFLSFFSHGFMTAFKSLSVLFFFTNHIRFLSHHPYSLQRWSAILFFPNYLLSFVVFFGSFSTCLSGRNCYLALCVIAQISFFFFDLPSVTGSGLLIFFLLILYPDLHPLLFFFLDLFSFSSPTLKVRSLVYF